MGNRWRVTVTIEKKVIEEFDASRGLEAIPTKEDAIGRSLFKHETLRDIICNYLSPKECKSIDEEELDSFTEVVSALISLDEEQRIGYYKED